jgi:uncharacterized membrane protein YecN with MAPEG domain
MVAPIYAAICGFLMIFLSLRVIQGRGAHRTALGDGQQIELSRRIRAQGNFAEYAPLFLILLFLAERAATATWILHGLGGTFLMGRLSHAYGLLFAETYEAGGIQSGMVFRQAGMGLTLTSLAGAALACLLAGP